MDELQQQLMQLIEQWRQTSDSTQRTVILGSIISKMSRSNKIAGLGVLGCSRDEYQVALQENWQWFIENLQNYDPSLSTVMYWFNKYLDYKIKNNRINPPASKPDGKDSSINFEQTFEKTKRCIDAHKVQLRRQAMRKRLDVSCDLIMAELLSRVEAAPSSKALPKIFAELAEDWQLERNAFRQFCSTSCFRLLRKLCPNPLH